MQRLLHTPHEVSLLKYSPDPDWICIWKKAIVWVIEKLPARRVIEIVTCTARVIYSNCGLPLFGSRFETRIVSAMDQ